MGGRKTAIATAAKLCYNKVNIFDNPEGFIMLDIKFLINNKDAVKHDEHDCASAAWQDTVDYSC